MANQNWPIRSAHSMTIGGHHTFRDWSMVPEEIPIIAPPPVMENYVDVPGMDGMLDYSDVLTGRPSYGRRTGSLNFIVMDGGDWPASYHAALTALHGQKLNCILDDEPEYFYTGRFSVNKQESSRGYSRIVIDYDLDPYRYPVDTSIAHDWLWNNLFDIIIYYGSFKVDTTVERTLINPTGSNIIPTFTCSAPITVTFNGNTYTLPKGTTSSPGFYLSPGDNIMTFSGTGRVSVDYALGKTL